VQNTSERFALKKDIWIASGAAIVAVFILIFTDFGKSQTVVYDCRDAHWHPDVPVEVKRECSRMMYEEWKKQREEERQSKMIRI
jgi:hypothetical protein